MPSRETTTILFPTTFIVTIWCGVTMCSCGHFGGASLILSLPGFLFGLVIFLTSGKSLKLDSILSIDWLCSAGFLILLSLHFAKSVADFFWFGHNPVFPL